MIALAYEHWPTTHAEQFDDADNLRKWLQMRAGHYTTYKLDLQDADPIGAVLLAEGAMKAAGAYARARVHGCNLVVYVPKSIAFHKLDQHEFSKLSGSVESIITAESGLDPEQLLEQAHDRPTQATPRGTKA